MIKSQDYLSQYCGYPSDHKSLSVLSPPPLSAESPPPPASPRSPILWIQKLSIEEEQEEQEEVPPYHFTTSTPFEDCSSQSSTSTSTHETLTRKDTYTVLVQAHNPPHPYSADLVFVHGSTSSSILSPTAAVQPHSTTNNNYSPHHLSNSFIESDDIDNTGLLIDSNYSQVFTSGSTSQESVPAFSSQKSENPFHINLTQTSQPDSNHSQFDYPLHNPELPVISELINNSPIDTFDLHHLRADTTGCHSNGSQTEYSYSQEYADRFNPTPTPLPLSPSLSNTITEPPSIDTTITTAVTSVPSSVPASIPVSASPPVVRKNTVTEDRKPSYYYYRYSLSHQRGGHSNKEQLQQQQQGGEEEDMAARLRHMKVVPSTRSQSDLIGISLELSDGETDFGFTLSQDSNDIIIGDIREGKSVCILFVFVCQHFVGIYIMQYLLTGLAASRCGLREGDVLIKINEISIDDESINQANDLLKEVKYQLFIYYLFYLFLGCI